MSRSFWIPILLLIVSVSAFAAPACISGNDIASYQALGSGGCSIGPLIVKDFDFQVLASAGGPTLLTNTDVTVSLTSGTYVYGLVFGATGPGFNVSGSQFVQYLIAFTWDQTPDIRGAGDILDPGTSDIITDGCKGAAFSGPVCSGTPFALHVFLGPTNQPTDTTFFGTATAIMGIRNTITLDAMGSSAGFTSIENDAYVTPEPGGIALAGGAALLFAIWQWFTAAGLRLRPARAAKRGVLPPVRQA